MGRIGKGVSCSMPSCNKEAVRSVSTGKARSAGLNFNSIEKRIYLCKEHYKEFKKKTKKDKTIEKWRYSA